MKSRTIRGKLTFLLTLAILLLVLVGTMGILGMRRINRDQQEILHMTNNIVRCERIVTLVMDLRIQLRECLVNVNVDDAAVLAAVNHLKGIDEELEQLIPGISSSFTQPDSLELCTELEELHSYLMGVRPGYYDLALAKEPEAMQVWLRTYVADALRFQALGEGLAELESQSVAVISRSNAALVRRIEVSAGIFSILSILVLFSLGRLIVWQISNPIQKLAEASRQLAEGKVDVDVDIDMGGEIGILTRAFQDMIASISEQAHILQEVAEGNYLVAIQPRSDQDVIGNALGHLVDKGAEIITTVSGISSTVTVSAEQLSKTALSLSAGASQQIASLEGFSETLDTVFDRASTHEHVTDNLMHFIEQLSFMVDKSNNAMNHVLKSMDSIDDSTQSVSQISKLIEDIAFQTNILALNASVEAARAGQHGAGFAVVASEVRRLATKAAQAAQETTSLTESSLTKVAEGSSVVESTNMLILDMKQYLNQSMDLFQEVHDCPVRRESTKATVKGGIEQITQVAQSTMHVAQETSATGEELSAQAETLSDIIQQYFSVHATYPHRHTDSPISSTDDTSFGLANRWAE